MLNRRFSSVCAVAVCVLVMVMSGSCSRPDGKGASKSMKVITTLFPLYDFARNIGKEKVEVSLLIPPGVEPHSFDPKPSDVVRINEADVFVFTGRFMEPWSTDILRGVTGNKLAVVDASAGVHLDTGNVHEKDEAKGAPDPHIWLDFENAKTMVKNIQAAFERKDAANRDFYRRNAEAFANSLSDMDTSFRNGLASCAGRTIVYGGHYAFGYLAKRYHLEYLAAQGISPDSEPTAKDLARLVEQIRKNNIRYIFFEELASPKIAQTVAKETGARMLMLNAGHNLSREQLERGISFLDIMKGDLENLRVGLGCR